MNIDDFEDISKKNRRRVQEADKNRMVVGPLPPLGIHEEQRKIRDKRKNLNIKKFIK